MAFLINGKRIEDEEFEEEFESIKEHYQSIGETVCCDRDEEFRQYAHDNVINRAILEEEAIKRFGDIGEEEVKARFEEIKKEHGGENEFYENTGLNIGDEAMVLRRLRSSMLVDKVMDADIPAPTEPSDEQLEAYYQKNLERYMSAEEIRVSQIFIEPSSHEAAKEAYEAMRDLRRELLAGKDFEEAAKEHGSDDERDIDLGYMKQGETMPEIEAITFSLEPGEISPVIATHYGFHIFQVTDRKEPAPAPRETIENLAEQFLAEERNAAVQNLIDGLKDKSEIQEVE